MNTTAERVREHPVYNLTAICFSYLAIVSHFLIKIKSFFKKYEFFANIFIKKLFNY